MITRNCVFSLRVAIRNQGAVGRATTVRIGLLFEGANGPAAPEADEILAANGIVMVPDVIANAGGVTVSYFERVLPRFRLLPIV